MKKIVLWICTVVMTLIASACIAGAYSPYFEAEPPREVREHNGFARRMPVVEEQIKVINHRIDDLENYHKPD